MKDLPAREKLDLAEMVAQYLVLASTLDKTSPLEDYDRANELSLELAMLLPSAIYRAMVDAVAKDGRARLTYTMDEKLLFALVTGLVSWNAIEASALMPIRRSPDVYEHDLHRSIVHFSLLS